jgi:protein O-mannosyl-transferase
MQWINLPQRSRKSCSVILCDVEKTAGPKLQCERKEAVALNERNSIMKKLINYLAASVALATFAIYLPALCNEFVGVWDDNIYIVENYHIRSLDAAFFRWAFFGFYASNWHPLTWITHAMDYAIWGLNPLGHHLTNIILHAVNTALVVMLAVKLLEMARKRVQQNVDASFLNDRTVLVVAGVTGLLFGIHPIHVESVAWAAERKDLLCALFFLLSIMMYTSYVRTGDTETIKNGPLSCYFNMHYLLTLGFFMLALMSKPMAVTLPCVLLILDWYPFRRIRSLKTVWVAGIEKMPFFALSLASSIITIMAQRTGKSIVSLEFTPLSIRVPVAVQSLVDYLGKMLLPLNLIPFYPYPNNVSLFSVKYLLAIGLVVGITTACMVLAKKQKLWLSAWGYYVVTLIPVLGIVQVGGQSMADRYTYLPSLGPFLIMGLCAAWIAAKVNAIPWQGILVKHARTTGAIMVFSLMAFSTYQQTNIWKNSFVLWNHVISKGFEIAAAYNNRGLSLDDMGRSNEAAADFERAITLDPRNYFAYNNLGVLYGKEGLLYQSIEYFLKAITLNPTYADAYCNLGLSYFNAKQYDNAMAIYSKAITLKKDFDTAYLNRGNLYFLLGNKGLALADYEKACNLKNKKACEVFYLAAEGLLSR